MNHQLPIIKIIYEINIIDNLQKKKHSSQNTPVTVIVSMSSVIVISISVIPIIFSVLSVISVVFSYK